MWKYVSFPDGVYFGTITISLDVVSRAIASLKRTLLTSYMSNIDVSIWSGNSGNIMFA
jgi:hypothetical protein